MQGFVYFCVLESVKLKENPFVLANHSKMSIFLSFDWLLFMFHDVHIYHKNNFKPTMYHILYKFGHKFAPFRFEVQVLCLIRVVIRPRAVGEHEKFLTPKRVLLPLPQLNWDENWLTVRKSKRLSLKGEERSLAQDEAHSNEGDQPIYLFTRNSSHRCWRTSSFLK